MIGKERDGGREKGRGGLRRDSGWRGGRRGEGESHSDTLICTYTVILTVPLIVTVTTTIHLLSF